MNKIEKAITEYWGPRCSSFNPDCHICQTWILYDQLITDNKFCDRCETEQPSVFCKQCGKMLRVDNDGHICCYEHRYNYK